MLTISQNHSALHTPGGAGRERGCPVTFHRFCRKGYAIFASLHREVRIGVLSVGMLASVILPKVQAAGIATRPMTDDEGDDKELSEVTVAGTLSPLTALQSARIVGVITCQQIESAAAQTVPDLLKLAAGVDVRQRGGFGIQTDISINGGTFDQITLLLNGVNISSPHTGHLAADFPVSLSDIERIEILEGAASRVYGASAFGGAINIVTKRAESSTDSPSADPTPILRDAEVAKGRTVEGSGVPTYRAREGADTKRHQQSFEGGIQGGSHGTIGGTLRFSMNSPEATAASPRERTGGASFLSISSTFLRSDGATLNSDFARGNMYLRGLYETADYGLDFQAGYSQKSYGANTFYSAAYPNQYERNRRFMISAGAETRGKLRVRPEVYWDRLYDNFELIRGTTTGENFHRTDVHGARVTASVAWAAGRTSLGAEIREEEILSTSLGRPKYEVSNIKNDKVSAPHVWPREGDLRYSRSDSRTNLSFNAEHTLLLPRFTLSAGMLVNKNSRFDSHLRLYPGIDVAYTPNSRWRLFASYNKGFRLPTFTDLYYKSPTHEGNQGMRAEESHSFQVGSKLKILEVARDPGGVHEVPGIAKQRTGRLKVESAVKAFYHRGTNMIDWVMYSANDVFHSANFDLDNMGVQVQLNLQMFSLRSVPNSQLSARTCSLDPSSARPYGTLHTWRTFNFQLSYAFIHQNRRDAAPVFKSNYAMEYLRHKVVCILDHPVISRLTASWTLRWQDRCGSYILYEDAQNTGRLESYKPYATLDAKLRWHARQYELWAEGTNLTNRQYYDLGNIPQPGFQFMGGIRLKF